MPSEDSKPVKAEIEEAEDKKGSGSKKVSKATNANAKPQPKLSKVKKEEAEEDDSRKPIKASSGSRPKAAKVKKEENDDDKPLAQRNSNIKLDKEQKKKKKIKEEEKKKGTPAADQKKREKKVYDLPGQKRDPPEEKDPLRIFYETLYEQVPHSEMAQVWMMESGLLPEEEAGKVYEKKQKKGLQQKLTSPVKALTSMKSSTHSVTVKKNISSSSVKKKTTHSAAKQSKKRKADDMSSEAEEDSDDEPILKRMKKRNET